MLVVDDDPDVRDLSALFLRELGYTVIEAPDGNAALAELHCHPEIVLLFTDIIMPEVDGVLLAERARALRTFAWSTPLASPGRSAACAASLSSGQCCKSRGGRFNSPKQSPAN